MPGPLSRVDVLSMPPITFPSGASVSVSNFPATQPVSGTVTANVTFPTTQQVSGSVSVSNFPATQAVTGTFWQATQPVSGTVSVGNFPATQAVSGTVTANLGTLNGAATAAGQASIVTALGQRLSVDDYRVPNSAAAGGIVPRVTTNTTAFVASNAPCNFFGGVVIARADGAGAYVFVLNRTTAPASGSTINMAEVLAMTGYSAGGGASLVPDQVPDRFSAGCVIIVSTSIDTYTPPTGTSIPKFIKARVL